MPKTNDLYEGYYNELGLVGEEEREEFWKTLRRELPNSFRFTGSKGYHGQKFIKTAKFLLIFPIL